MQFKSLFLTGVSLAGLALAVSLAPAQSNASDALTRDDVKKIIKEYLMEEPKIVLDAYTEYQRQEEAKMQAQAKEAMAKNTDFLFKNDDSPFIGNKDGDVTVVEFFDYNCGYCKKVFDDVNKLAETDKNVRIVFKEYPILSPASELAARYALAAREQGKYFEFHAALMNASGSLDEDRLTSIARGLDLDVDQLKKDADGEKVRAIVAKNREKAMEIGVRGTPGFIIGDELIPGAVSFEQMKQAVDDLRAKTKAN